MIYVLMYIIYTQANLDISVQSVEARAMFSLKADCDEAANKKRTAFSMVTSSSQPAWRDAQCVPVAATSSNGKIADGFDGL